ncbi:MAG: DNA-binding protein [Thermoprotei archaeon]|nr:MAG: DNA-binding protein [Thermoprotei archaeon]
MKEKAVKIRSIKAGMEHITLVARVVSISEPKYVLTKYGRAQVASAVLEDETGRTVLNLWRWQIKMVRPGDIIRVEGAFATSFKGRVELNVGSKGRIIVLSRKNNSPESDNCIMPV